VEDVYKPAINADSDPWTLPLEAIDLAQGVILSSVAMTPHAIPCPAASGSCTSSRQNYRNSRTIQHW
jgi:hypothetical protein